MHCEWECGSGGPTSRRQLEGENGENGCLRWVQDLSRELVSLARPPKCGKPRLRVAGRLATGRTWLKAGVQAAPPRPPLAFLKPSGSCFPVSSALLPPSTIPPVAVAILLSATKIQSSPLLRLVQHRDTFQCSLRLRRLWVHSTVCVISPIRWVPISFFRVCPCGGPCFGANVIARDSRVSSQATPTVPPIPTQQTTRNPEPLHAHNRVSRVASRSLVPIAQ